MCLDSASFDHRKTLSSQSFLLLYSHQSQAPICDVMTANVGHTQIWHSTLLILFYLTWGGTILFAWQHCYRFIINQCFLPQRVSTIEKELYFEGTEANNFLLVLLGCNLNICTSDHKPVFASFDVGITSQHVPNKGEPSPRDVIIKFHQVSVEVGSL